MASIAVSSEPTSGTQSALGYDMKLEVVTLPVSDVDRAKRFYESLGWRLDADIVVGEKLPGGSADVPALGMLGRLREGRHHGRPRLRSASDPRRRRHRCGT